MKHPATRNWQNLAEEYDSIVNSRDCIDNRCHLSFMRKWARGNVLEIGTDVGHSTTALLLGIKENGGGHLYSMDINPHCAAVYAGCPFWTFKHGDSGDESYYDNFPTEFNIAYIDGDHSYEALKRDLAIVAPRMKSGGWILLHDVEAITPPNVFPGVKQAYDEIQVVDLDNTEPEPVLPKAYKYILHGDNGLGVIQLG